MMQRLLVLLAFLSVNVTHAVERAASETSAEPGSEEVAPSPEALAALAAAQAAGDKVRACKAALLANNEEVQALAAKEEAARQNLTQMIQNSPAFHDLTQRIARAEAQLEEAVGRKGTNSVLRINRELQPLRTQLAKDRRNLRLLSSGEGLEGGDIERLRRALDEATTHLNKTLNTHPDLAPLLRAHYNSVQAYLKVSRRTEPPATPDPGAAPDLPPPPPSGSP